MPAELLCDVAHAGRPIPARRFSMLPVSIAVHLSVAILVLLVPLAAEVELPFVRPQTIGGYMSARPVPAAPPAASQPSGRRSAAARGPIAPSSAPMAITPERLEPSAHAVPAGLAVEGGLGEGTGARGAPGTAVAVEPPQPPALRPPAPPAPVRPGGAIREPQKILDVAPVYPALARSGGVEGVVILEAVINVRGEVERLRVLRSEPLLDRAAIDAVQRWRYTPTLLNGIPVPVLITVTVRFALR